MEQVNGLHSDRELRQNVVQNDKIFVHLSKKGRPSIRSLKEPYYCILRETHIKCGVKTWLPLHGTTMQSFQSRKLLIQTVPHALKMQKNSIYPRIDSNPSLSQASVTSTHEIHRHAF